MLEMYIFPAARPKKGQTRLGKTRWLRGRKMSIEEDFPRLCERALVDSGKSVKKQMNKMSVIVMPAGEKRFISREIMVDKL